MTDAGDGAPTGDGGGGGDDGGGEAGRRRRRRRRGGQEGERSANSGGDAPATNAATDGAPSTNPAQPSAQPQPPRGQQPRGQQQAPRGQQPQRGQQQQPQRGQQQQPQRGQQQPQRGQPQPPRGPQAQPQRGQQQPQRGRDDRGNRGPRPGGEAGGEARKDDRAPRLPGEARGEARKDDRGPRPPREARDDAGRAKPVTAVDAGWDDEVVAPAEAPVAAAPPPDDDEPAPPVTLGADLPAEPAADDPDPVSVELAESPVAALGDVVANVLGVRLVATGKIFWCDAGAGDYRVGDVVVVDSDRSTRLATVAVAPARRGVPERLGRVVLRVATEADRAQQAKELGRATEVLRLAKDKARDLRLPAKMFRVEYTQPPGASGKGGKLNLYYTSDERVELRELLRDLGNATGARIELRQVGVRDEAKHVGGIGSCGQELCCTTWLPDFVPVSIKMAKDQGLVLNPTKVSGQCGRLKCCLVYEQATYAELRKGLPKLGKRVITATGEGRVVEVDVLRQRVRVSFGPGESQVMPASEVKPMFPAQGAGGRGGPAGAAADADAGDAGDDADLSTDGALPDADPTALPDSLPSALTDAGTVPGADSDPDL